MANNLTRRRTALLGMILAVTLFFPASAEECYTGRKQNAQDKRFWESEYLSDWPSYYVILDRETGCKYLHKSNGSASAMAPLIAKDRLPDCSGTVNAKIISSEED